MSTDPVSLCQRMFNAVIIKEIMKYWCRSCAKHIPCEFATPHCCCNAAFITMEDGASRERSFGKLNTHLLGVCLWEKFGCCESLAKLGTLKHRFLRQMLSDTLSPARPGIICPYDKYMSIWCIFVSSWRWVWWALKYQELLLCFCQGRSCFQKMFRI